MTAFQWDYMCHTKYWACPRRLRQGEVFKKGEISMIYLNIKFIEDMRQRLAELTGGSALARP
jgi:hypothetical protein